MKAYMPHDVGTLIQNTEELNAMLHYSCILAFEILYIQGSLPQSKKLLKQVNSKKCSNIKDCKMWLGVVNSR